MNVVTSTINPEIHILLPTGALSYLLQLKEGHVTCSDQWNLNHKSFLSRTLEPEWSAMLSCLQERQTIDGDGSIRLAASMRLKQPVTDLQHGGEINLL